MGRIFGSYVTDQMRQISWADPRYTVIMQEIADHVGGRRHRAGRIGHAAPADALAAEAQLAPARAARRDREIHPAVEGGHLDLGAERGLGELKVGERLPEHAPALGVRDRLRERRKTHRIEQRRERFAFHDLPGGIGVDMGEQGLNAGDQRFAIKQLADGHSGIEGGAVAGVIFESKEGRLAIRARVVVDATGDGDLCARAGNRSEQAARQEAFRVHAETYPSKRAVPVAREAPLCLMRLLVASRSTRVVCT